MPRDQALSVGDLSRLLEIVTDVVEEGQCTPSQAIERIGQLMIPAPGAGRQDRAALAEFAARLRRVRMRRNEIFGAPLFRDPAWDMLLELFVANERGVCLSVSSVCYASGVPMTTALRQLTRLEEQGLIEREGDRGDNRRCFVRPTARAIAGMERTAAMIFDQSQLLESAIYPDNWAEAAE